MKFKNRLDAPESIHMRGFSPKNEQIWPRGLGCRGGATDFGGFSPCISITSVVGCQNKCVRRVKEQIGDLLMNPSIALFPLRLYDRGGASLDLGEMPLPFLRSALGPYGHQSFNHNAGFFPRGFEIQNRKKKKNSFCFHTYRSLSRASLFL